MLLHIAIRFFHNTTADDCSLLVVVFKLNFLVTRFDLQVMKWKYLSVKSLFLFKPVIQWRRTFPEILCARPGGFLKGGRMGGESVEGIMFILFLVR